MSTPSLPTILDGAEVLFWLSREDGAPYYFIPEGEIRHPIVAMAICQYADTGEVYLFKCDPDHQVWADTDCGSVEEAMEIVEYSFGIPTSAWRKR